MIQFNLEYPENDKIYFSKTPKEAAKNAFNELQKKNKNEISRIIISNNNSKKNYEFIAITDKKIKQFTSVYQSRNPIQLGGSSNIDDDQFYDEINKISGNINLSVSELSKILNKKFKPNNDEVILLLQDGISKIENINHNISIIADSIVPKNKNFIDQENKKNTSDDIKSINNKVAITLQENKGDTSELKENKLDISKLKENKVDKLDLKENKGDKLDLKENKVNKLDLKENKVDTSDLEDVSEESNNLSTIDIKKNIKNDINKNKLNLQKGCSIM